MQLISQSALEEAVLALLIYSEEHAPTIAAKVPDALIFTNQHNKAIAQAALDYVRKYQLPAKGQLEYLLEAEMRRGEYGRILGQQFDFLAKQYSQVDAAFVLEQLDRFISSQQLHNQLREALELLDEGDYDKAQEVAYKSKPSLKGSPGIWLKDPSEALSFLDREEENEFFSSGIKQLDERGVRPRRKTLYFVIGSAGRGKSWYLTHVGKGCMQHHHSVLHITLEISETDTARRYIQSIFSLTKDEVQTIRVPYFERNADGSVQIQFQEIVREPILAKRSQIARRLAEMRSFPDVVIKEFPTGSLTVSHLTLYLDQLEREQNFKPDCLILDYADLMYLNADSLRLDTGRLYRELRGLAVSRNMSIVTATQGNRESEDAKLVTSTNVAEDWSKIGTADVVLTYSQTPEERRLGLARIFVQKARDAGDRFIVLISQAYPIGQFVLDSTMMNSDLAQELKGGSDGAEQ